MIVDDDGFCVCYGSARMLCQPPHVELIAIFYGRHPPNVVLMQKLFFTKIHKMQKMQNLKIHKMQKKLNFIKMLKVN